MIIINYSKNENLTEKQTLLPYLFGRKSMSNVLEGSQLCICSIKTQVEGIDKGVKTIFFDK